MALTMMLKSLTILLMNWNNKDYSKYPKTVTIDQLEDQLLLDCYEYQSVLSKRIDLTIQNESWSFHYIQSFQNITKDHVEYSSSSSDVKRKEIKSNPKRGNLLLVHGYGTTSALAWRNIFPLLDPYYDVYAIDLPGFGRSHAPPSLFEPSTSADIILVKYCQAFEAFQQKINLTSPFIVAHSFGGFLYTHCISKNPQLASKLLLSDVPGIFSINGGLDFVWATFFAIGFPQAFLRPLGEYGHFAIRTIMSTFHFKIKQIILNYWHELQTSEDLKSEIILSKFIMINHLLHAVGYELALVPFLKITIPVAILTGQKDSLSSPDHAEFLQELSGVTQYTLDGTGHVPYILNQGRDFVQVILKADLEAKPLVPSSQLIASCLDTRYDELSNQFRSSPVDLVMDYFQFPIYFGANPCPSLPSALTPQLKMADLTVCKPTERSRSLSPRIPKMHESIRDVIKQCELVSESSATPHEVD